MIGLLWLGCCSPRLGDNGVDDVGDVEEAEAFLVRGRGGRGVSVSVGWVGDPDDGRGGDFGRSEGLQDLGQAEGVLDRDHAGGLRHRTRGDQALDLRRHIQGGRWEGMGGGRRGG